MSSYIIKYIYKASFHSNNSIHYLKNFEQAERYTGEKSSNYKHYDFKTFSMS